MTCEHNYTKVSGPETVGRPLFPLPNSSMASGKKSKGSPARSSAKSTSPRAKSKPSTKGKATSARKASAKAKEPAAAKSDKKGTTASTKSPLDSPEFQPIVRDLIRLAKEQDYLTFDDINEALPDTQGDLELMEELIERLQAMKFRIIDSAEVDNLKSTSDEEESASEVEAKKATPTKEGKLDILDDPVRMYLKQMGQVPLLTREQEVEISKRIEKAESDIRKTLAKFGFIPDAYLDIAARLESGEERFDRLIVDKKIESRSRYLKNLQKLCTQVTETRDSLHKLYADIRAAKTPAAEKKATTRWSTEITALGRCYNRFYFKQKVTEDLVAITEKFAAKSEDLRSLAEKAKDR
ncbi:MAG: sigma-70 factor domain-containing protein, partial [Verrucomicrobiota bacterium]